MIPIYLATGKEAHIGDIVRLPDRGYFRIVEFVHPNIRCYNSLGRVRILNIDRPWIKAITVMPYLIGIEYRQ